MMRTLSLPFSWRRRQRGFSIVAAVFLLVVLSVLGAVMLTFTATQQVTSTQDIQGSRAYQAARTGIEWGLYQVLIVNGASACPAASTTLPSLAADLQPFAVVITCTATPVTEASASVSSRVFSISATATLGALGTPGYVERRIDIRI
ncbi:hypothetical protein E4K72_01680 [Oxalobacteraceae bacterium OM1]|nr:hypothetical protein E4K72_01680 [Oxalobacteraceae bacterium OM1]